VHTLTASMMMHRSRATLRDADAHRQTLGGVAAAAQQAAATPRRQQQQQLQQQQRHAQRAALHAQAPQSQVAVSRQTEYRHTVAGAASQPSQPQPSRAH
jgi:hypothetical protein